MSRTWTLRQKPGEAIELFHHVSGVTVRAFDEAEAAPLLLEALGLEPYPCCRIEDELCAACSEAAYERHQERMLGEPSAESPEQIRAGDADRGSLPERRTP